MKLARRFLLPSSLARLVHRERASTSVIQGFFATREDRNSHLHIEGGEGQLVLVSRSSRGVTEERTDVPRAHAEALVHVCVGHVMFERSRIDLGEDREALVDRLVAPARVDAVMVEFDGHDAAAAFSPPAWFGPEITGDDAYENRAIALEGAPGAREIPLSDTGLDALLDAIEGRAGAASSAPGGKRSEAETIAALRILAASLQDGGAPRDEGDSSDEDAPAAPAARLRPADKEASRAASVDIEDMRSRRAR